MKALVLYAAMSPHISQIVQHLFHMYDREYLFDVNVYHMLHFSTINNKGEGVSVFVFVTKGTKMRYIPIFISLPSN